MTVIGSQNTFPCLWHSSWRVQLWDSVNNNLQNKSHHYFSITPGWQMWLLLILTFLVLSRSAVRSVERAGQADSGPGIIVLISLLTILLLRAKLQTSQLKKIFLNFLFMNISDNFSLVFGRINLILGLQAPKNIAKDFNKLIGVISAFKVSSD